MGGVHGEERNARTERGDSSHTKRIAWEALVLSAFGSTVESLGEGRSLVGRARTYREVVFITF
jgi:hypothetical protein